MCSLLGEHRVEPGPIPADELQRTYARDEELGFPRGCPRLSISVSRLSLNAGASPYYLKPFLTVHPTGGHGIRVRKLSSWIKLARLWNRLIFAECAGAASNENRGNEVRRA